MARLASIVKGGYYATPDNLLPVISSWIKTPAYGGRIEDPCAGKGRALAYLAQEHNLEAYANELNTERHQVLKPLIDNLTTRPNLPHRDQNATRAVSGDIQALRATLNAMQVMYLNPPYDHDYTDARLEYKFLKLANHWLQAKGLLIFVIPQHVLGMTKIAKYLSSWYTDIVVRRFPDEDYETFKQIVIFGKKNQQLKTASSSVYNKLRALAESPPEELDVLDMCQNPYTLPKVSKKQLEYHGLIINADEAFQEVLAYGADTQKDFLCNFISDDRKTDDSRPLMPLKIGHLVRLTSAGYLNNQIIENSQGERLLIRGRSIKAIKKNTTVSTTDAGTTKEQTKRVEYPMPEIVTLSNTSDMHTYSPEEVPDFLSEWAVQLTRAISEHYEPIYKFKLGKYKEILGKRGSLFAAQKHTVAAICTRLKTHRDAIVVGEMGTGKTRIAAGIIYAIFARRALIMCPPHLYKKWMREVLLVIPEAKITHLATTLDVDKWMEMDQKECIQIGVIKTTSARAASGWIPSYDYFELFSEKDDKILSKYTTMRAMNQNPDPLPDRLLDKYDLWATWKEMISARGVRCPTSGQSLIDKDGFKVSKENIEKSRKQHSRKIKGKKFAGSKERPLNLPLFQYKRGGDFKQSLTYAQWRQHADRFKTLLPINRRAALQLWDMKNRNKRGKWRLADYIKKKYPRRIDITVFDEVHQLKSPNTDQGYAFARLAQASKKVLSLTGTIYGGRSSSLFFLLYRTAVDMAFAFTDRNATGKSRIKRMAWVHKYGMLEYTDTTYTGKTGQQSGNSKTSTVIKEAPGSSPSMLPWLLSRSVFLGLSDLGKQLPDYEEIPIPVDPTPAQLAGIKYLDMTLGDEMRKRIVMGDRSLLGAYLQSNLCWPDSPWRDEIVTDPRTRDHPIPYVISHVPALPNGNPYPKEEAIIDKMRDIVFEQGQKVLLLCQQTRSRDITGYWSKMLSKEGFNPAVLRIEASKREEWIAKQNALGVNVLIAHPKSVETGLDLLEYPHIIWMGIEYSIYTVLQASRRSWRIGQTKPVSVYFFYYTGTLQEKAIQLIAQKSAAATRVNGDVITDASLADMDTSTSISDALTKMILNNDEQAEHAAASFFAKANDAQQEANAYIGDYVIPEEDEPDEILVVQPGVEIPSVMLTQKLSGENGKAQIPAAIVNAQTVAIPLESHKDPSEAGQLRIVFGTTLQEPLSKKRKRKSKADTSFKQLTLFG